MSLLFSPNPLLAEGHFWLTLAEKEDANVLINQLARSANEMESGSLAILEARPVLISNLRAWENLILPRWYHHGENLLQHDRFLHDLLQRAEVNEQQFHSALERLPGQLDLGQRRVIALLRAYMQEASCWVLEEEWLEWLLDPRGRNPVLAKIYQCMPQPKSTLVLSLKACPQEKYQEVAMLAQQVGEGE